ncbi:Pr6Pr family membrane protein [Acholeplasma laidlawii]|uniref:Pr6Pr family membrane protein n=1 Tax=Acholeplasma laidlawii TaxID=2148 RepID=UPI0018C2C3D2|nr:Pr6Pr family membrane protein [Acholeplasma laidlawii]MBG0763072.1 Pr6Pr family membrane protein [Acholeplasma laidlawii]
MSNWIQSIRDNKKITKTIAGIIFIFNVYAMIDLFFLNESMVKVLERLRMFTNISNIIVFVVVGLCLLNLHQKKWYKYLAVIGLVAILMTGIIYHALLAEPGMSFQNHVVHTINPALFAVFYYLLIQEGIKLRHVWVSLILPTLYFGIILAVGPWTNWYPYNFMNPTYADQSLGSVLIFCLGIMLPVIVLFTVLLVLLKNFLEKLINKGLNA